MDGMIDAPDTFRPGGNGKTTPQLIARIAVALGWLPHKGRVVVITHGGPIACARATRMSEGFEMLPNLVPPAGSATFL